MRGLLIGATPLQEHDLPKYHGALRAGILAVASLTSIGWNVFNIGILVLLIYKQVKHGAAAWVGSLQSAFSAGTMGYGVWALFLTLATPWLFR